MSIVLVPAVLHLLTSDMVGSSIRAWDKTGTCMWIKNSKLLSGTTCYCCDM